MITSEELKTNLRDNLTAILARKGITPYRLAKMTGEPLNTMYRIVRGENEPGTVLLLRIAEALQVPVETLTKEKREKSRRSA